MIDVHCHLEQKDYDKDRDEVIAECGKKLKAVVSSSPHFPHFEKALELHKKYHGFVFISLAIHPIYINEISELDIEKACLFIRKNIAEISSIGETGLDYFHVKDKNLQARQRNMFEKFVKFAKELEKPLVVHCRDAFDDCISILEQEGMKNKKVLMHLMMEKEFLPRIIKNGWSISIGPSILKSKGIRKICRDCPLDRIMLETDSPWFGDGGRGTPLNVIKVAEKIAEIKKISVKEVEKQTDLNAIRFFNLK